ncbi:MAG: 4-hydroxythreonine-4-phosphate dehydrogenase PdxA [Planctomycetes bacterium]|nr:4-hydroxythreonine-4-phosphate dehydrogenase PdxA [Planctomycetota bacterium]
MTTTPTHIPTIAITLGDPGGIGPEVIVKALADERRRMKAKYVIYGLDGPLQDAAKAAKIAPFWSTHLNTQVALIDYSKAVGTDAFPATHNARGGKLSAQLCEAAILHARDPGQAPFPKGQKIDAIVTGPISKESWALAGWHYPGHTELFAERFETHEFGMFFASQKLKVILATIHIPLAKVPSFLSTDRVLRAICLGHDACQRLGIASPRIAVAGVNPHAGENGLLGREEKLIIEPAILQARQSDIDVRGPFPGDTIFLSALQGKYDLVVAMYHDQGLIPVKLLCRDEAVNVTVGLPIIRTSPDHGTGFDIAGKNKADPGSMASAIDLAIKMWR